MITETVEQSFLEKKEALVNDISEYFSTKRNSYDGHTSEKAYWSVEDSLTLARCATSVEHLDIAQRMYKRWKYYL